MKLRRQLCHRQRSLVPRKLGQQCPSSLPNAAMQVDQLWLDGEAVTDAMSHIIDGQVSVYEDWSDGSGDALTQGLEISGRANCIDVAQQLSRDRCTPFMTDAPLVRMDRSIFEGATACPRDHLLQRQASVAEVIQPLA